MTVETNPRPLEIQEEMLRRELLCEIRAVKSTHVYWETQKATSMPKTRCMLRENLKLSPWVECKFQRLFKTWQKADEVRSQAQRV